MKMLCHLPYYTLEGLIDGVIAVSDVWEMFPDSPDQYTVIYTLDTDGPFMVGLSCGVPSLVDRETGKELMVCFLPYSWVGESVQREVIT